MYGICKPEKNVGSIIGIPRIPKILFKLGRANNSLLFNLTILSESIQSKRRRQRSQEGKNKRENLWDGIPDGRSGQGEGRKNSQHTARVTGATRNSVVLPQCFARLVTRSSIAPVPRDTVGNPSLVVLSCEGIMPKMYCRWGTRAPGVLG